MPMLESTEISPKPASRISREVITLSDEREYEQRTGRRERHWPSAYAVSDRVDVDHGHVALQKQTETRQGEGGREGRGDEQKEEREGRKEGEGTWRGGERRCRASWGSCSPESLLSEGSPHSIDAAEKRERIRWEKEKEKRTLRKIAVFSVTERIREEKSLESPLAFIASKRSLRREKREKSHDERR
jgi:hypothetical protein